MIHPLPSLKQLTGLDESHSMRNGQITTDPHPQEKEIFEGNPAFCFSTATASNTEAKTIWGLFKLNEISKNLKI